MHTNASLLAVGAMLALYTTSKYDQPKVYVPRLFNKVEYNYSTIERETFTMVYAL